MNKTGSRENRLWKLFSLPWFLFYLRGKFYKQKRFIKEELEPQILPFQKSNDGSITAEDLKKLTTYYALGVPMVLGEAFAILRGVDLTRDERYCLTCLGGISGLLDDLFDDPARDAAHLFQFIAQPAKLKPKNSYEALLVHLYQEGLSNSMHPELLKIQAEAVFTAQEKSLQQQGIQSAKDLKDITFSKGGSSFLFYRLCLETPVNKDEEKLVYHLGGLMQLANDIFDLWEDLRAGIQTVATCSKNIKDLRKVFFEEFEITFSLARATPYPEKQTDRFLDLICLGLSRVFVCLDQFERLQKESGGKFKPENYKRKQLICDMQKISNQIAALRYYLTLKVSKQIT